MNAIKLICILIAIASVLLAVYFVFYMFTIPISWVMLIPLFFIVAVLIHGFIYYLYGTSKKPLTTFSKISFWVALGTYVIGAATWIFGSYIFRIGANAEGMGGLGAGMLFLPIFIAFCGLLFASTGISIGFAFIRTK